MFFYVTALVLLSVLSSSSAADCPQIVTQKNFNTTAYLGLWYEIERNEIVFEIASKCENATYTLNPNGTVGVWNQAVTIYSGYYSIHGIGVAKDPNNPAALEIIFTNPDRKGYYNVLSTDYTESALVYACEKIPLVGTKLEFIWLLSRTKSLPQERIDQYKTILTNMGVDANSVKPTEQNCS